MLKVYWPWDYINDIYQSLTSERPFTRQAVFYSIFVGVAIFVYFFTPFRSRVGEIFIGMARTFSGEPFGAAVIALAEIVIFYMPLIYLGLALFLSSLLTPNAHPDVSEEELQRAGLKFDRRVPEVIHFDDELMILRAEGFPRKVFTGSSTSDRFRSVFDRSIVEVNDAANHGYPEADYALVLGRPRLEGLTYGEFENQITPYEEQLFIGVDRADNFIHHTMEDATHVLVAGETGSGKSLTMRQILVRLLETSRFIRVGISDLKGGIEFAEYVEASDDIRVYDNREGFVDFLQEAANKMDERLDFMKEQQVKDLSEMSDEHRKRNPRIVIVMDEFAELFETMKASTDEAERRNELAEEAKRLVSRIARLGRAPGVHLIMATQRPSHDIMPMQVRDNLPTRMVGSLGNKSMAQHLVDDERPARIKPKQGIFLYKRGAIKKLVQVPLLENDEAIERLRRASAIDGLPHEQNDGGYQS